MAEWLCTIRPPRPTFADDASEDEDRLMGEHFRYLQRLMREGKLLLAGPAFDPLFGIIVLVAETKDEAWELVQNDPSVRAGLQTPELQPFRAALIVGRE
jgi:uncharacterized protein YciI